MKGLDEIVRANTKRARKSVVNALVKGRINVPEAQALLSPARGVSSVFTTGVFTGAQLAEEKARRAQ